MTWNIVEQEIRIQIKPNKARILKCVGTARRPVITNDGVKIGMKTGVQTNQTKAITYDMIKYAYDTLIQKGMFDSRDFRKNYNGEYKDAPCRYSMVGGILVELGIARRISTGRSCNYQKI